MPTNLAIDDGLVKEAQDLGHHRTKREAVNQALSEYVRKLKRRGLAEMFGTVEFNSYDYKAARKRR